MGFMDQVLAGEAILEAIASRVRDLPGIGALALFGSRARGSFRPDSDLDIAVLVARGFQGPRLRLQAEIAALLVDLAPGGRVDVVLVDEAPELLRQRIFEDCKLVVLTDPDRWNELRICTMWEHGDREPYREILRTALHERLARKASP